MRVGANPTLASQGPPELPRRVHFLGICGRMVGGIALALKKLGVHVTGTDGFQFPPMPGILREAGIPVHEAWSADNLPRRVDAVVTGALLHRGGPQGNPELEAAMDRGLPIWNSTSFLQHYFLRRTENFVVAGTKGKTTTTAMLAWIMERAGREADHMIGGQVRADLPRVRLSRALRVVLEGDEYRSGLGDPMPKFLRYHPRHVIVTNVVHDHLEVYPTARAYGAAFADLVDLVPSGGSLTINADDEGALALVGRTPTPVRTVGFCAKAECRITQFRESSRGISFRLLGASFKLALPGRMNAADAALAAVCARHAGIPLRTAARALRDFPGVRGRLELVGQQGRTLVYDDEAYHPLALRPVIEALGRRHPRRRIVVVLEPRYTGGRDSVSQRELPGVLAGAGLVLATRAIEVMRFEKPFDSRRLCRDVRRLGAGARFFESIDHLVGGAPAFIRDGDIVLVSLAVTRAALVGKLAALAAPPPGDK